MRDLKSLLRHHGAGSWVRWLIWVFFFCNNATHRPKGMAERGSNGKMRKTGEEGGRSPEPVGRLAPPSWAGQGRAGRRRQNSALFAGGAGGSALLAPRISGAREGGCAGIRTRPAQTGAMCRWVLVGKGGLFGVVVVG